MRIIAATFSILVCAIASAQPPKYEVLAIRYGTVPQFPVSALVQGAEASRKIDIAMMVWLIRGGGRNVLVDSGFYRPRFFRIGTSLALFGRMRRCGGRGWRRRRLRM